MTTERENAEQEDTEQENAERKTLRHIAEMAGVSAMTVSNVINGRPGKVREETAKRVRDIIAKSQFVPNAPASALKSQRSKIIALVYPFTREPLANQHDAAFVGAVEQQVSEGDRHLMIWAAKNVATTLGNLRRWRMDGAIYYGTYGTEIDDLHGKTDVPIVFVDNYSESSSVKRVRVDDHRGGELAARHLLEKGHRKLGFVGPPIGEVGVVSERFRGFREAIEAAGLRVDDPIECAPRFEDGRKRALELSADPDRPTGLFAAADILALGLLHGFLSKEIGVPEDVSLIGFDDIPEAGRGVPSRRVPALSTIRQDIATKAQVAVEMLDDLIEHGDDVPNRPPLSVELVQRGTVGPPPP